MRGGKRRTVVFYDETEDTPLGALWALYAATFPDAHGVATWDEVRDLVEMYSDADMHVSEFTGDVADLARPDVQVWGHGWKGRPLIDGVSCPVESWWTCCKSVWFRSCSTMDDERGLAFGRKMAQMTDVAGHLNIIGYWGVQSWLVGARRGTEPWWEHLAEKVDARGRSAPWQPRTVTALKRHLPEWAFDG